MIQRIQSIYLFVSSIFQFALFAQPVHFASRALNMDAGATSHPIWADGKLNVYDSMPMIVLSVLGGLCALLAIFLYKNRSFQQKLAYLSALESLATIILAGIMLSRYREGNSWGIAWILDMLAVLLAMLAARAIGKDEALVRSSDRLR